MTRMPNLWATLTGEPVLTPAQRDYESARKEAIRAELAGDDRALGRARMSMQAAQCERPRLGE
jgi:hypothetical protein